MSARVTEAGMFQAGMLEEGFQERLIRDSVLDFFTSSA